MAQCETHKILRCEKPRGLEEIWHTFKEKGRLISKNCLLSYTVSTEPPIASQPGVAPIFSPVDESSFNLPGGSDGSKTDHTISSLSIQSSKFDETDELYFASTDTYSSITWTYR